MVRRKLVDTRTGAQRLITEGRVNVAGVPEPKPATMVAPDMPIVLVDEGARFVSRGGEKLQGALEAFSLDVTGRRALDVGASTGGFTDCLLQNGAASVVAIDVGYGQIHWKIRQDSRVEVIERTNFRYASPVEIGAPFDLVVVDVSFISVATIAANLAACGTRGTDYVVLVKPQFEVGRDDVGRGGIVKDPALHASSIRSVGDALAAVGLGACGAVASPIMGTKGNREFLVWAQSGAARGDIEALAAGAIR